MDLKFIWRVDDEKYLIINSTKQAGHQKESSLPTAMLFSFFLLFNGCFFQGPRVVGRRHFSTPEIGGKNPKASRLQFYPTEFLQVPWGFVSRKGARSSHTKNGCRWLGMKNKHMYDNNGKIPKKNPIKSNYEIDFMIIWMSWWTYIWFRSFVDVLVSIDDWL